MSSEETKKPGFFGRLFGGARRKILPAGDRDQIDARQHRDARALARMLQVLAEKDVQEQLSQLGFEVWPSKTPEEFAKYVGEQLAQLRDHTVLAW